MTIASAQIVKVPVAGGDLEIEFRRVAPDDARPLVLFLHGWTFDRRMWAPQMEALSSRFSVVAMDRRGFGGSTAPPGLDREPDDVIAVLDTLAARSCILVGMSQGCRVALEFAVRHPARARALVLQGPQLDGFLPAAKPAETIPIEKYRALAAGGKMDEMRRLWRAHPLMHTPNANASLLVDEMLQSYEGRDLLALSSRQLGIGAHELQKIPSPTLVVTGDQEAPWRRLVADAIAYGAPDASEVTIENAGHVCNLCNAESYNAVLAEFIEEVMNRK